MIGCIMEGPGTTEALEDISAAERAGVPAAWMTTAGAGLDAMTIFAAAAVQTERIGLGASIIPTWPRHPIVVAQQAQVIEQLAPGRLVIGLGSSSRPSMERLVGANWREPRQHMREYVTVLKTLLDQGKVDVDGSHYTAHAQIASPIDVPVMIGTLRANTYKLAGEIADGAISWLTPWHHIRDVCLPQLEGAAKTAGRETPRLVVHQLFCLSEDVEAVRSAVRTQFGFYTSLPSYAAMFAEAGFPDLNGSWSDALTDALVVHGDAASVIDALVKVSREGASDIIANPVFLDGASKQQAFEVVAEANRRAQAAA
jgi:F420-dependent oxidoreductase-like protein